MIRIEGIGNVGRDAELKMLPSGTAVLNWSMGVKGSRKDAETVWLKCALFGARAEKLGQYLTKGSRVFVRGEAKLRSWTAQGGKSGTDLEVTVDELELLGGKPTERSEESSSSVEAPADW